MSSKLDRYPQSDTIKSKRVSKLIKAKRKRQGLTPEQLAEKLGTTRSAIYRWENQRVSYAAILLINWLLDDESGKLYWKERAIAAETSLRKVTEAVVEFRRDVEELDDQRNSQRTTTVTPLKRPRKSDSPSAASQR